MTWNDILHIIGPTLVTALAGIVLTLVYRALTVAEKWITSHVDEQTRITITRTVRDAVAAAEQAGIAGIIENIGEAKKAAAINWLQFALDQKGIHLDIAYLEGLIEAAVYEQLTKYKETPPRTS